MRLAAHSASTELAELRIVLYSSRTLLKRSFTMESVENSRNNRGCHELLAPTMMTLLPSQDSAETHPVQVSAFSISSKSFLREAMYVFPNLDLSQLTVVNTMQRARVDLVKVGEDIEDEKDRLILVVRGIEPMETIFSAQYINMSILQFFSLAKGLCDALRQAGHWADYIDPCSGLPVCTIFTSSHILCVHSYVRLLLHVRFARRVRTCLMRWTARRRCWVTGTLLLVHIMLHSVISPLSNNNVGSHFSLVTCSAGS